MELDSPPVLADRPSALLKGIVADAPPPTRGINLITHDRAFDNVGDAAGIAASPAVVHFGGFQPGAVHRQTVRLVNTSPDAALRAHVMPPESPYFKVTHRRCPGATLPGLSDSLVVEFCPDQLRYYYDAIRVHSSGGNLLIPLHGYPTANAPSIPRRVDFGRVPIGERAAGSLPLRCRIPMDFEFTVRVTKRSDAFSVAPVAGVVPAGGAAEVEVVFHPVRHQTEEMLFEVTVAEFGAQPMVCTVVGSASPGLARDRELGLLESSGGVAARTATAAGEGAEEARAVASGGAQDSSGGEEGDCFPSGAAEGDAKLAGSNVSKGSGHKSGSGSGGGGGGARGDAFSRRHSPPRGRRREGSEPGSLPRLARGGALLASLGGAGDADAAELRQGDVFVPQHLRGHGDVSYVLNQAPGKLRTKDVKAAISVRRAELAEEQRALAALAAAGGAAGVDALDRPGLAPALKEALFQLQLRRAEEASKRCTGLVGAGGDVVGGDALSPRAIAAAREARAAAAAAHQREVEEAATHRLECEMSETGALHVLPHHLSSSREGGSTRDGEEQQQQPDQESPRPGSEAGAGPPHSAAGGDYAGLAGFAPQWVQLESNHWRKRVQVMQSFISAARVVIYRLRAQKRLQQIKAISSRLAGDGDGIAGAAAQALLLQSSKVDRPGVDPALLAKPALIAADALPPFGEDRFESVADALAAAGAGAGGPAGCGVVEGLLGVGPDPGYADWDQLEPEPYAAEYEYRLLGYSPEEMPGLVPYMPPLADQPLLSGASEDSAAPRPVGPSPAAALAAALGQGAPDALRQMPLACYEIGARYAGGEAYAQPQPVWGIDMDHLVQPALLPRHESWRSEAAGSCSVRALAGAEVLAQRWQPANLPWEADPSPFPAPLGRADPSELLVDRAEDADKPRPAPALPTDGALAAFLPAAAQGPAAQPSVLQSPEVQGTAELQQQRRPGAGPGQGQGQGQGHGQGPGRGRLPRQLAAAALDAEKLEGREARLREARARADGFNRLLSAPHMDAVRL